MIFHKANLIAPCGGDGRRSRSEGVLRHAQNTKHLDRPLWGRLCQITFYQQSHQYGRSVLRPKVTSGDLSTREP